MMLWQLARQATGTNGRAQHNRQCLQDDNSLTPAHATNVWQQHSWRGAATAHLLTEGSGELLQGCLQMQVPEAGQEGGETGQAHHELEVPLNLEPNPRMPDLHSNNSACKEQACNLHLTDCD